MDASTSDAAAPGLLRNLWPPFAPSLDAASPEPPSLAGGGDGGSTAKHPPQRSHTTAPTAPAASVHTTAPAASVRGGGVKGGGAGGGGGGGGPGVERSRTLVVATCAGVWHKTLSLVVSLEGSTADDFDFLLAVRLFSAAVHLTNNNDTRICRVSFGVAK